MLSIPWDLTIGWSIGYSYIVAKNKEDEVKQGKNYYLASLCQASQISALSSVISPLADSIPYAPLRISSQICKEVVPLCSWIVCPTLAAVKQGHYQTGVKAIDVLAKERFPLITNKLPEKLNDQTISVCGFLSEHMGDIVRVGVLAGAAALPIIGNAYLAGAMLAPVAYQAIESRQWIPRRISSLMENYMPMISSVGLLLGGGSLITQIGSAVSLASFSPTFNRFLHKKMDNLATQYIQKKDITLEEIDAPLVVDKELSFEEINRILDGKNSEYEINPAHCTKWANLSDLPEESDFQKYQTLFDSIEWDKKYSMLKRKFRDDDRFLDILKTAFPGKEDFADNFESYVTDMAAAEKKSKEQYLVDQLKGQMSLLIKILNGEVKVKGSQSDLEEAIHLCAQILCHLTSLDLKSAKDKVEIEDALLDLAVEGGDYCARGIKRTAREMVDGILQQGMKAKGESVDPIIDYELKLRQTLQQIRKKIIESTYLKIIEATVLMLKEGPSAKMSIINQTTDPHAVALAQDVHTMDFQAKCLFLGFHPLTEGERNSFGMTDILQWKSPTHALREIRIEMYQLYQKILDDAVKEVGEINFGNYIRQVINTNPKLSEEQREAVIDKYINHNEWKWSSEQTKMKFHRLMFVMLGILRQEEMSKLAEWTSIDFEDVEKAQAEQEAAELAEWTKIDLKSNQLPAIPAKS